MKTASQTSRKSIGACLVAVLAGSLLAMSGWTRAGESEGSAEVDVSASQQATDATEVQEAQDLTGTATQKGSLRELRKEHRRARADMRLERIRSASQATPKTQAAPSAPSMTDATLTDIGVWFKLDPQLAQGSPTEARWVPPPGYAGVQEGAQFTVEAKAQGLDASGKTTTISPAWVPTDPNMVEVSPGAGEAVKIIVRDAGQSRLIVAAPGVSKELSISAISAGRAMHVQISQ